jgi:myo-inositol-1(or 4)-monophosphatase
MDQKECVAGNPRVYGQLVGMLSKYSKFASAGEKASVRNAPDLVPPDSTPTAGTQDAADEATRDAPF